MRCWAASPLQPPGTDPGGQAGPRRERLSSFTGLPGCRCGAGGRRGVPFAGGPCAVLLYFAGSFRRSSSRDGSSRQSTGRSPSSVRAGVTIQAVK
jgi:hypothetical protein